MHSLTFSSYPRYLVYVAKYVPGIWSASVNIFRRYHNTDDQEDQIKDIEYFDKSSPNPIKKEYEGYHNNDFRTLNSPLRGFKSKNQKFSPFGRPPTDLIETDQVDQLNDIKEWFKMIRGSNVESTTNVNVHKWKQASQTRKYGFSTQGDVLYGIHPVNNALQQKRRSLYKLFLQNRKEFKGMSPAIDEIVLLAKKLQVPVEEVPRHFMELMSGKRPHQGVCLDASPLPEVFHDVEKDGVVDLNVDRHPLWLVLYKIMDPMNLGAILRSAHFLSVDRVIRTRNDSCSLTPVVSKASSGALESMALYTVNCRLAELVKAQKDKGWKIVATSAPSQRDIPTTPVETYRITQPTMLFIGNEGDGIPDSIHNQCDDVLTIQSPNHTNVGVNSLNVSVAAGIILHSLMSRR